MARANGADDLILQMVRSVVDTPAAVRVKTVSDNVGTTYRIQVAESEIGQVIGKQGRTARSLRTILAAVSMRQKHRFTLDILTKDGTYQDSADVEN